MPHIFRLALAGITSILITLCTGCGGSRAPQPPGDPVNPRPQTGALPHVPAPQPGVQMPFAPATDFDMSDLDKSVSALYRIFFRDAVNHQSAGRWTLDNTSGTKAWTLSNTFFSS